MELLVVIAIAGITLGMAISRTALMLDRIAVHAAGGDVAATINTARTLALASRSAVAVHVDSATGVISVRLGDDIALSRSIRETHGVQIRAGRDSLAFDARGLGHGAANMSIVLHRRAVVETVFVSRLGRVR